jgi:predicted nucleic acid-binding protein
MRRYLLDTCAMGDLINRRKGVHERARAARLGGARLGTCIPVLGELFFGIEFSQTRAENRARLIRAITGLSLSGPTRERLPRNMDDLPHSSGELDEPCNRSTCRSRPSRSH